MQRMVRFIFGIYYYYYFSYFCSLSRKKSEIYYSCFVIEIQSKPNTASRCCGAVACLFVWKIDMGNISLAILFYAFHCCLMAEYRVQRICVFYRCVCTSPIKRLKSKKKISHFFGPIKKFEIYLGKDPTFPYFYQI